MNRETAKPFTELEERLRFETLRAELSSKFDNLPAAEVDREIIDAQRRICEFLNLDLLGAYSLNATRAEHDWPGALVNRLRLVAQIFANALARKRFELAWRQSEKRRVLGEMVHVGAAPRRRCHRRWKRQEAEAGAPRLPARQQRQRVHWRIPNVGAVVESRA